ncbi:MAG TPA: DUF4440 domain-containing protein [Pyrinomonadaceae bacterium]
MRIVTTVLFTVLISIAVSAQTSDQLQQQIVQKEREELDTLKTGDTMAFAALLADDAVFLNSRGPSTKAEVVKHVADFRLREYSIEDLRYVPVGPRTGLIIYKLTQKIASQGREFSVQVRVSALWTEREGKWVSLFSQETPAK